jgi:hypothetical protein
MLLALFGRELENNAPRAIKDISRRKASEFYAVEIKISDTAVQGIGATGKPWQLRFGGRPAETFFKSLRSDFAERIGNFFFCGGKWHLQQDLLHWILFDKPR